MRGGRRARSGYRRRGWFSDLPPLLLYQAPEAKAAAFAGSARKEAREYPLAATLPR